MQSGSKVGKEEQKDDKGFSEFQLAELNQSFQIYPFMHKKAMGLLAARLNLSAESVSNWFIRKRTRLRERFLQGNSPFKVTNVFLLCYCNST